MSEVFELFFIVVFDAMLFHIASCYNGTYPKSNLVIFYNLILFSNAVHYKCNIFTGLIQQMFDRHCGYWWPGV